MFEESIQKEISNALNEISTSLRLLVQPKIEERLSGLFSSNEEMKVYELTDGDHSSRDIEKQVSFGKDKIIDLWKIWETNSLVESHGAGSRKSTKANYTLIELAIKFGKEK